eukprot:756422-Hanusia_phi.AAC.2
MLSPSFGQTETFNLARPSGPSGTERWKGALRPGPGAGASRPIVQPRTPTAPGGETEVYSMVGGLNYPKPCRSYPKPCQLRKARFQPDGCWAESMPG